MTASSANPSFIKMVDLDPSSLVPDQEVAIRAILAGPPSIYLFKHYHWLAGRPLPIRRNGETNDQYTKVHWRHLVRAARAYKVPLMTTAEFAALPSMTPS